MSNSLGEYVSYLLMFHAIDGLRHHVLLSFHRKVGTLEKTITEPKYATFD